MIFRSVDWILERLDVRAQREMRRVLRTYEQALDARLVAVFATGPSAPHGVLMEYHGDDAVMPRPFPFIASSIPSHETVACVDGDEHAAVVHRFRIGRGLPALGIVVLDVGALGPTVLDAVEECADKIEDIVVRAIA